MTLQYLPEKIALAFGDERELRCAVEQLGLDGGIHLHRQEGATTLQFLGRGGEELSSRQERPIEQMLSRSAWPAGGLGHRADGCGAMRFSLRELARSGAEITEGGVRFRDGRGTAGTLPLSASRRKAPRRRRPRNSPDGVRRRYAS